MTCVATRCTRVHQPQTHIDTHTDTQRTRACISEGKIRKVIDTFTEQLTERKNFPSCVVVQLDRSMID